MFLEGERVITASEMTRIEKLAYAEGASALEYMEKAGAGVAAITSQMIEEQGLERCVTLFVGKGNNGGDAYVAGRVLHNQGFTVWAYHFFPLVECSDLCQEQCERFQKEGGDVHFFQEGERITLGEGILLDGLVGTGFHGKATGKLEEAITIANRSGVPIIAIDIPSGLDGDTGEVGSVAIQAALTISLGFPKWGFFVGEGWNHVGQLAEVDYGLHEKAKKSAQAKCVLIDEKQLCTCLPPIKRNRHKYQAGYVLALAGSLEMPGAALLSCLAALRSGAGIVRLFHPLGMGAVPMPPEIIRAELHDDEEFLKEVMRASALLVGPGLGRTKEIKKRLRSLLPRFSIPSVLDADALYFLAENPEIPLAERTILTPHRKEMERLLGNPSSVHDESAFLTACQQYVEKKRVTLVLKGAPTLILHPGTLPLVVPRGDPGMATAGAGDVLTGVLAALLAQGLECRTAAVLGVFLHAVAGEDAAMDRNSYSMIASDIIDNLSHSINSLR